jgi:hypothetical protein
MSGIRWKSFAAARGASLCATCVWGTVRKGYRSGEWRLSAASSVPTAWFPFPCASVRCTEAGAHFLDLNYCLDFRFLFATLFHGRGNGKQALPAPLPSRLSRTGSRLLIASR